MAVATPTRSASPCVRGAAHAVGDCGTPRRATRHGQESDAQCKTSAATSAGGKFSMTTTQHPDEQTLIAVAMNPGQSNPHIDECAACRHDLELWSGIADATRISVASVPPPREELAERILAHLGEAPVDSQGSVRLQRHGRPRRPAQRTRWLVAATLVALAVALVAITLSIGSAGPSTASVLRKIRNAPSLMASSARAVYVNTYSTIREKDGYVVIHYRINGVFDPRSKAFKVTFTTQYPGAIPWHRHLFFGRIARLPSLQCQLSSDRQAPLHRISGAGQRHIRLARVDVPSGGQQTGDQAR